MTAIILLTSMVDQNLALMLLLANLLLGGCLLLAFILYKIMKFINGLTKRMRDRFFPSTQQPITNSNRRMELEDAIREQLRRSRVQR